MNNDLFLRHSNEQNFNNFKDNKLSLIDIFENIKKVDYNEKKNDMCDKIYIKYQKLLKIYTGFNKSRRHYLV